MNGLTNQSSFTAYFAFNEDVSDFVADDIGVSGGSASKGTFTKIADDNYSLVIENVNSNVAITVAANAGVMMPRTQVLRLRRHILLLMTILVRL